MPEIMSMSPHPPIMQDKRRYSTLAAPHLDRTCFQVASRHQAIAATTNPYWHQLSIRAAPYSLHDNLVQSSQFSPLFGAFSTHGTEWSVEPVLPTTFATPLSVDAAQSISYATHADYPESSQRTELSSSPVNAPVDYSYRSDAPKSPSQSPDFSEGRRLYTMDDMDAPASCRSSSLPPIKMEQQDVDGCFVMELSAAQVKAISLSQSMAPPTEVPLRATHASAEMRKMMGRFRIDPFAIHSGENRGIVASWCGEACPLEEEPLIFEFQLDIGNVHSDTQEGSSTQADLETQTVDSDAAGTQWDEYCSNELIHSEWDEEHRSSEPVAEYYRRQVQEMQETYLHKCAQGSSIHLASNPSQDLDHTGDRSEFWPRNGSFNAPLRRSTTYTADSPACNNTVLPSISATITRRWSVPDPHMPNEVQFLMQ